MLYRGLPIYNVSIGNAEDIDYEMDDLGLQCVSIVDDPAVQSNFLKFEKEDEKTKILNTFSVNIEERKISGVAIRADFPIYRNGGVSGKPFYVVFSKKVIKEIVERMSKKQRFNNTSLDHNGTPLNGVYMTEMYIKDEANGINPKSFSDIQDGSLFMTYYVDNEELWEKIKNGNYNGFSIEIASFLDFIEGDEATEYSEQKPKDELEEFIENIFNEVEDKKKINFVDESSVKVAIENDNIVEMRVNGDTHKYQIFGMGKDGGDTKVIVYDLDDKNKHWKVLDIDDIEYVRNTNKALKIGWEEAEKDPSFINVKKAIDDISVERVATTKTDMINQAIDEGIFCMINYNDEKPFPHLGSRQCKIVCYGYTTRNNECIRVYEDFGDSRSALEGTNTIPNYRLMLTKRITNLRLLPDMKRWTINDLDDRYKRSGDDEGMSIVKNFKK